MSKGLMAGAVFLLGILLVAALAKFTEPENEDPCANAQSDISAAVIADGEGDQDALVNRAIILKGKCKQAAENSPD